MRTAANGRRAVEYCWHDQSDVLIVELELPDMDGFELIRIVRAWASTPILVLSERGDWREEVKALDSGADDYLVKPFGEAELVARVRVALRHAARPESGSEAVRRAAGLEVDFEHRSVRLGGQGIRLSSREYQLLKILVGNPEKLLTEEMLLGELLGPSAQRSRHYLHVYMARLRKKLAMDPQVAGRLLTEPGIGYRFMA